MNAARRPEAAESAREKDVSRRRAGLAAAAGAVLVLALAPATAASAHDYLVSSTPPAGSTVSTPLPRVTLGFDDIVLDEGGHGALVQVTDSAGRNYETACASVSGRDVSVPVALGAPGGYRVTWQIVSADGHPVSSSIQFRYAGPEAGTGHAGPLAECGTSVRAPAADGATGGAQPRGTGLGGATLVVLGVAGGVVVLAVVAVLVVLLTRRRSPVE